MELRKIYEDLHAHPECSMNTHRTANVVAKELQALGLTICHTEQNGIIACLEGGKKGKTVALRAELDALPVAEKTGLPYASQNAGVMHACGHDFHTTALIGAAALLVKEKDNLHGNVQFIFQPDEEEDGYAAVYNASDCMKDTAAVFGAHVDPTLPYGIIGIKSGTFYASAAKFDVEFIGKSAHGATPYNGADALAAAADTIPKLLTLREAGETPVMISVGTFHSGTARNIIADRAHISGIIRSADPRKRDEVHQNMMRIFAKTEEKYGVTADLHFVEGFPGVTNPPKWAEFITDVAKEIFGDQRVVQISHPLMTTEDFGEYLRNRDGCFYHIGVGGTEGLHSSAFAPDPALLEDAALLHAKVIMSYLR